VSEALVEQTAVGDRVRIAAAEGELAFPEPARASRLLAVAHGTGAAPVLALIQEAVATGDARPVTVVLVSDGGEHYLAAQFDDLAARHGAVAVEQVVGGPLAAVRAYAAADASKGGTRGAVLVGPSAMVDRCRAALIDAGLNPDDVASDLFD
jgi:ferredoxin-NADP reductase